MQSQFYSYQPVPIPQAHPQPIPQQLVPMQAPNYTVNNTHYTPQQYLYIAPNNNTNNNQIYNVNDELNQEQSPTTTNPFIDNSNTNNKEIKTERSNDRPSLTKYINSGQRTAAVDLSDK